MRFFLSLLAGLFLCANANAADLWRPEGQPAFMDSNGNPYAGAKLCYYDAGTTNARTVYKDAAASVAWSQPITLNAGGGLEDPIYVPTGAFKEVVLAAGGSTCSDTSTLFTSDNVPGALDVTELGIDFAKPDRPVLAKASAYTVQTADLGKVINADATGGAFTITLPSAITAGDGAILSIRKTDSSANAVTIDPVSTQTIDEASNYALSNRYENVTLVGDGANWHTVDAVTAGSIVFADLASAMVSTDTTLAGASSAKLPTEGAVKTYVDTVFSSGVSWLDPVAAASTTNLTKNSDIENGDTLDGVTLSTGDRVLLKDQSTASENGVWIVAASGAPTRATDIDQAAEFTGATVFVSSGSANASDTYTQTATVSTVDTDDVDWSLISSGVTYSADGATLQKTGTTFAVKDGGIDNDAMANDAIGADEIIAGSVPKADLVTAVQEALVPTGTVLPYAGTSAPSGYLLAHGQCVSDTTYADLDTVLGSTWDTVNGCSAGEVGIPDLRGRVIAGQDDMGGSSANRLLGNDTDGVGVDGDTFGATGGEEKTTDVVSHTHGAGSYAASGSGTTNGGGAHTHNYEQRGQGATLNTSGGGASAAGATATRTTSSDGSHTHTFSFTGASVSGTSGDTGDASVTNMQPTIILNYIIKT